MLLNMSCVTHDAMPWHTWDEKHAMKGTLPCHDMNMLRIPNVICSGVFLLPTLIIEGKMTHSMFHANVSLHDIVSSTLYTQVHAIVSSIQYSTFSMLKHMFLLL